MINLWFWLLMFAMASVAALGGEEINKN